MGTGGGGLPGVLRLALSAAALFVVAVGLACGGGGAPAPEATSTAGAGKEKGATIIVNSTADADVRDGELTLREAVLLASGELTEDALKDDERDQVDGTAGSDRADNVVFDDSAFPADGTEVIALESALPPLLGGGDVVDGKGVVIIDGGDKTLVCFSLTSDGNEVMGLRIYGCQTAVLVREGKVGNRIGLPGEGNVLSGNQVGVEVQGENTVIQGNIIGLDPAGTERLTNEFEGIWLTSVARDTVVGGPEPGQGNVISGNTLFGVSVDGAQGTVIQGNIIGLDAAAGVGIFNRYGISLQFGARGALVGGDSPGARNVISGNRTGILIQHSTTSGNTIKGNYIGTDGTGQQAVPNGTDIALMTDPEANTIGENVSLGPLTID